MVAGDKGSAQRCVNETWIRTQCERLSHNSHAQPPGDFLKSSLAYKCGMVSKAFCKKDDVVQFYLCSVLFLKSV